jgi:hypothetical protein
METFDTYLQAASDYLGGDGEGDELIDRFRGFLSDDDGGEGRGSSAIGALGRRAFGSLFGGGDEEDYADENYDEDGEDDGGDWSDVFGRMVDRVSGAGGREGLWDRAGSALVDRVSRYLPEELRGAAGQLFGGEGGQGGRGSSWAGSLVDTNRTEVPSGWHAVANHPTIGHSFGESGFGGFLDHSIANLSGNFMDPLTLQGSAHGGGAGFPGAPGLDQRTWLEDDPTEYSRRGGFVDTDGDGYVDRAVSGPGRLVDTDGDGDADVVVSPGSLPRFIRGDDYGADVDGGFGDSDSDSDADGLGSRIGRPGYDTDGDGYPDRPGPGNDDRPDYDELVTSGAPAARHGYVVPDDPTFPNDPAPVEAPANDFQQSIADADQVEQAMDDVFDGPEGT